MILYKYVGTFCAVVDDVKGLKPFQWEYNLFEILFGIHARGQITQRNFSGKFQRIKKIPLVYK